MDFEISPASSKPCKKAGNPSPSSMFVEPWNTSLAHRRRKAHADGRHPSALIRNSIPTTTSWFCAITACVLNVTNWLRQQDTKRLNPCAAHRRVGENSGSQSALY